MSSPEDLVEVRLLRLPLEVRARSTSLGADLLRDMTLIAGGQASGSAGGAVPRRLLEVADEVQTVYRPMVESTNEEIEAATDRGEEVLAEVVYRLPPSAADFMQRIESVLEEVEAYCTAGKHLLMLAAPPDVAAYRSWTMSEIRRQIAGHPPTPWPEYAAARGLQLS